MTQWVKCLLCKRENLSLELRYIKRPIKNYIKRQYRLNPQLGGAETSGFLEVTGQSI